MFGFVSVCVYERLKRSEIICSLTLTQSERKSEVNKKKKYNKLLYSTFSMLNKACGRVLVYLRASQYVFVLVCMCSITLLMFVFSSSDVYKLPFTCVSFCVCLAVTH